MYKAMKKVFKNHSEVCHVWASQSQESGSASNINFNNESIYSYGWWIMAKFINNDTVLIRNWSYSSSTGKHLTHVHRSLAGYINKIYCYNPDNIRESLINDIKELKNNKDKFKTAIKRKESIVNSSESIINNINKYLTATNNKGLLNKKLQYSDKFTAKTLIKKYSFNEAEIIEAKEQTAKIEIREAEKKRIFEEKLNKLNTYIKENVDIQKEYNIQLSKWQKGEINSLDSYDVIKAVFEQDKTFDQLYRDVYKNDRWHLRSLFSNNKNVLRIHNNQVETNQHATVSIKQAELLWHRINIPI